MRDRTFAARLAELHAAARDPLDEEADFDLTWYLYSHAEAILALLEAGAWLDTACVEAADVMDYDIVPEEWAELVTAHRNFRAALEALE